MDVDERLLYGIVGERLKQRRAEANVTQAQLAEAVGVLRTSVTNIEAGRQKPPLHLLYRMCVALDVEVSSVVPSNEEVVGQVASPSGIYGNEDELPPGLAEILKGVGE
ncbi:MAG: helix-turn-helix transcriptional regulator [Actinomycetota bacterium]